MARRVAGVAGTAVRVATFNVENLDTLKRFRSQYLGGSKAYPYAVAIDGNDPRLIDIAVLSKQARRSTRDRASRASAR